MLSVTLTTLGTITIYKFTGETWEREDLRERGGGIAGTMGLLGDHVGTRSVQDYPKMCYTKKH